MRKETPRLQIFGVEKVEGLLESVVPNFIKVAALAGVSLRESEIREEILRCPHRPVGLPTGQMAVYVFLHEGRALKVGKAGPNSDARFRSQHYNVGSAQSTLAASILQNPESIGRESIEASLVGQWIKENTERRNYYIRKDLGVHLLTLLEAYIQCSLNPVFEGFRSQR